MNSKVALYVVNVLMRRAATLRPQGFFLVVRDLHQYQMCLNTKEGYFFQYGIFKDVPLNRGMANLPNMYVRPVN